MTTERTILDRAARAAIRAFGDTAPNPLVGAVIVKDRKVLAIGHHTRFGHLHAEREAIARAKTLGHDVRGATLYCTLEPCSHHGKQPPCTDAIIESGIARVVAARPDPCGDSGGGKEILEDAGVACAFSDASDLAVAISDPFVHTCLTGLPWVIAKWAQTIDGRIATRTGESRWITAPDTRRRVHKLRARVDAVIVGIGTALHDDPMLNPRDVRRVHRSPIRVVLDTNGRFDPGSKLARSASEHRTLVCTAQPERIDAPDVEAVLCERDGDRLDLRRTFKMLQSRYGITTALVEPGPTLLGSLLDAQLVDDALVHLAPGIMSDDHARPCASGRELSSLSGMSRFRLLRTKRIGDDVELHYRRPV